MACIRHWDPTALACVAATCCPLSRAFVAATCSRPPFDSHCVPSDTPTSMDALCPPVHGIPPSQEVRTARLLGTRCRVLTPCDLARSGADVLCFALDSHPPLRSQSTVVLVAFAGEPIVVWAVLRLVRRTSTVSTRHIQPVMDIVCETGPFLTRSVADGSSFRPRHRLFRRPIAV